MTEKLSLTKTNPRNNSQSITKESKSRLDHLVNLAIFEDGRTFSDFLASAMKKFLAEAIPDSKNL